MAENSDGGIDKNKLKQEILGEIHGLENVSNDHRTKAIVGSVVRPLREALDAANRGDKTKMREHLTEAEAEIDVLESSIQNKVRDPFNSIRRKIQQL